MTCTKKPCCVVIITYVGAIITLVCFTITFLHVILTHVGFTITYVRLIMKHVGFTITSVRAILTHVGYRVRNCIISYVLHLVTRVLLSFTYMLIAGGYAVISRRLGCFFKS